MINGARVRQARELAMMTQAELADEVGIPQSRLSAAEVESRPLPDRALTEIAATVGFPPEFFSRPKPLDFNELPIHFRARTSMSRRLAQQARRGGEVVAEAAVAMLNELEGPPCGLPTATATNDLDDLASAVRHQLAVSSRQPLIGLPLMLENLGVVVLSLPMDAARRDAFSLWLGDLPLIVLLRAESGDRQLWSTAHELAHLLLHRDSAPSPSLEQEADDFAARLLTPPRYLAQDMPKDPTIRDLTLLKRTWGVSIAALIRSGYRLGKMDKDRYTSLFRQMSARGERLRERAFLPPVKPRGFRAMAEAYHSGDIVTGLSSEFCWTSEFATRTLAEYATSDEVADVYLDHGDDNVIPLRRNLGTLARNP